MKSLKQNVEFNCSMDNKNCKKINTIMLITRLYKMIQLLKYDCCFGVMKHYKYPITGTCIWSGRANWGCLAAAYCWHADCSFQQWRCWAIPRHTHTHTRPTCVSLRVFNWPSLAHRHRPDCILNKSVSKTTAVVKTLAFEINTEAISKPLNIFREQRPSDRR